MGNVSVLVVDDSATMRQFVTSALQKDSSIEVVGQANDPYEARGMIKALNPDVITLDIEMPGMNGLEFLEKIMRLRPTPVVMVSTLTKRGAGATIEALELGAVDYVAKPTPDDPDTFQQLPQKVKQAAAMDFRFRSMSKPAANVAGKSVVASNAKLPSLIALGASTGGVEALISILRCFPEDCPPTVVTQHMPALFANRFARRLNNICAPKVFEAGDVAQLQRGCIYIASGEDSHLHVSGNLNFNCRMVADEPVNGHRPSVDVMFETVANSAGNSALGVILTGMGNDGAAGLLAMRNKGARTIGQDKASCVVYGMPKAAYECGAVETQLPLDRIAKEIFNPS